MRSIENYAKSGMDRIEANQDITKQEIVKLMESCLDAIRDGDQTEEETDSIQTVCLKALHNTITTAFYMGVNVGINQERLTGNK